MIVIIKIALIYKNFSSKIRANWLLLSLNQYFILIFFIKIDNAFSIAKIMQKNNKFKSFLQV